MTNIRLIQNLFLYNNYINQEEKNINCDGEAFGKSLIKHENSGIPNLLILNENSVQAVTNCSLNIKI